MVSSGGSQCRSAGSVLLGAWYKGRMALEACHVGTECHPYLLETSRGCQGSVWHSGDLWYKCVSCTWWDVPALEFCLLFLVTLPRWPLSHMSSTA